MWSRGLGRVVDGLAVVRVRARREQQRGHARLVRDAGRAVERAERAELRVLPARVRVGAGVEQRPRAGDQPVGALAAEEGGVRDVEQRQPARARRRGRVAAPASRASAARTRVRLAEHERRVEPLAAEVRVEREQRLGVVAPAVGRLLHEPPRAVLARDRLRLGAAHEPRPARLAELARDRELRVGELERLAARPRVLRPRRFASRRARSRSIRPASIADHLRVARGPQRRAEVDRNTSALRSDRGGPGALPADQGAPFARSRGRYARRRAASQVYDQRRRAEPLADALVGGYRARLSRVRGRRRRGPAGRDAPRCARARAAAA